MKNVHLAEHGANLDLSHVADRQRASSGDLQVSTAK